jgi:hypothetical protein
MLAKMVRTRCLFHDAARKIAGSVRRASPIFGSGTFCGFRDKVAAGPAEAGPGPANPATAKCTTAPFSFAQAGGRSASTFPSGSFAAKQVSSALILAELAERASRQPARSNGRMIKINPVECAPFAAGLELSGRERYSSAKKAGPDRARLEIRC